MNNDKSKSRMAAEARAITKALEKYLTNTRRTIAVDGVRYSVLELVKKVDAHAALLDETMVLRAQWSRAVAAERMETEALRPFYRSLRQVMANQFGETSEAFAEFGYRPRKVAKRSTASKARAVAKQAATRAAHDGGTNGASRA